MDPERSLLPLDGITLAYREAGAGDPVLLLHGVPTHAGVWDPVVPRLAERHRVLAPDLLHCGGSSRGRDPGELGVAAQAGLVARFLEALDAAPAAVVGHDVGGGIAQHLAIGYPQLVRRLVLVDSVCYDSWPIPELRALQALSPVARHLRPEWLHRLVKNIATRGYHRHVGRDADARVERYVAALSTAEGADAFLDLVRALDAGETQALAPRLRALQVPTLVLWGEEDPFQDVSYAYRLHEDIPRSELALVEGAGHFVMEDAPGEVADHLARFLAMPPPRSAMRAR